MGKYTEQQKLNAVEAYLSGSAGLLEVAKDQGVDVSAMRSWIAAYREHGKAGLEKKKRVWYSAEFKISVLERMRNEGLSYRQVAALFDIRRFDVVGMWERQYDEGGFNALIPKPRGYPKKMTVPMCEEASLSRKPEADEPTTNEDLLTELKYLRAENAYLKKLEALA